jgi:K+-sensing histidine kinase KdpD
VRAYGLAVALPVLFALLFLPFREDHGRTAAIVLVVPVVLVATMGATGPAIVAAVVAGLAYDLFLTEPYFTFVIDDPDEVVAMAALLAVGLIVGWLSSRIVRLGASARGRRNELAHLIEFSQAAATAIAPAALIQDAGRHVAAVLDLESCEWQPGPHHSDEPVLLPDGSMMGYLSDLGPDRAQLPRHSVVHAAAGDRRVGSFVLTARAGAVTSVEERRTAATIVQVLAGRLAADAAAG